MAENHLAAAQAKIDELVQWGNPRQALMGTQLRVLLDAYHDRWKDEPWETVAIELAQVLPIVDPETRRLNGGFKHAGKLDLLLRHRDTDRHFIGEHKTASDDISKPDAPYWRRLTVDGQVSKYQLQAWQEGTQVDGVLYDVVRKPKTDPKFITAKPTKTTPAHATREGILTDRTYFGQRVDDAVVARLAREAEAGVRSKECLALYGHRLAAIVGEDPDAWMARRIITRTQEGLLEYAAELSGLTEDIQAERERGLHPRNSSACWDFNRPCQFLGLCAGSEDVDLDPGWTYREFVHPELAADLGQDADAIRPRPTDFEIASGAGGRNIVTNSRLKTFQSCRRKHHYAYDLGLRRVGGDTAEALWMGDVWHQAQEAWWEGFRVETNSKQGAGR